MSRDSGAATVLVVEDTIVNRNVLTKGVQREGHHVLQAEDGRQALDLLAREHVDMVLLDLLMPEVDGFEVLATMARDQAMRDVPVLVISAVEASEDIARAIEMGAIDCLPKPFDPVILRVRLRTTLEQARLRRIEQDYLRQELALRQQERLATLGRLSAGLGHELNNPAAAALSTSRQLAASLDNAEEVLARLVIRKDAEGIVAAIARLRPVDPPSSVSSADAAETSLAEALAQRGVSDPWSRAADLVAAGVTAAAVETDLEGIGDGLDIALAWFAVRRAIRESVDRITRSVTRITELTQALRGYSYLDRAPQQDVDVRQGLDDTLTIMGHKLPAHVQLVREYADDLPVIDAYGSRLNQVWTNLIDNAIDAVAGRGRITVRAQADGSGVLVEVEDDGPGIPGELQGRVFDPFMTTKPPGQGTGLGLNISHQIVTGTHGGQLTVESASGRTVFRVRLPPHPPEGSRDDS